MIIFILGIGLVAFLFLLVLSLRGPKQSLPPPYKDSRQDAYKVPDRAP